jgi:hypothetical protein
VLDGALIPLQFDDASSQRCSWILCLLQPHQRLFVSSQDELFILQVRTVTSHGPYDGEALLFVGMVTPLVCVESGAIVGDYSPFGPFFLVQVRGYIDAASVPGGRTSCLNRALLTLSDDSCSSTPPPLCRAFSAIGGP